MIQALVGLTDCFELLHITGRRAGAVGVDIVYRAIHCGQRLLHTAHRAFAGGGDHIVAIRGGTVTDQLRIDFCAPGLGVFQFFYYQHTAATGDNEAVAVGVVGARGAFRRIVVLGGEGAHGIKQAAQRPVQFFAATGKDHVLLAQLYLLHGIADTVGAGGAGR